MKRSLRHFWGKLGWREKRLLLYFAIVLAIVAWRFAPRYWKPSVVVETAHYRILSTATREQAEEIGRVAEMLYGAYSNRLGALPTFDRRHSKLRLLLYRDRDELRRINPGLGWAEAFYQKPNCHAYYSAAEINPYHWMLHEAVHQLNAEVAHLHLVQWLEEGMAEYFSTSRIQDGRLDLGSIDPNTYPVWWIDEIATDSDLKKNLENGSVIPLRSIVTGQGGPAMRTHVNLYYLHWWTLTHHVFENSGIGDRGMVLLQKGGGLAAFEEVMGPMERVQDDWHAHTRKIKKALSQPDIRFMKTGRLEK